MSPRARTAVRWLAWIGGIALLVLVATGVYVTFRYRPDASGTDLAMARLHRWSGIVVGPVAVVITALLIPRRVLRVYVAVLVFFVAWTFTTATGRRLVWDQVGLSEVTVGHDVHGVFFLHHPAVFVLVDGHEYSWEHFRNLFWLHSALLPMVMAAAFVGGILWARRLRRQPDVKSSAETPAAIRR